MATFVGIFNKKLDKVLLIKRNAEKKAKYGFSWGIVGGKIELTEYSVDAVIREVREETGIKLNKENTRLLFIKEEPTFFTGAHTAFFFYGAVIDENTKTQLNDESEEIKWFDVNKLPEDRSEDDILEMIKVAKEKFKNE